MPRKKNFLIFICSLSLLLTLGILLWKQFMPAGFSKEGWNDPDTSTRLNMRWKMRKSAEELILSGKVLTASDATNAFGRPEVGGNIPGRWRYKMRATHITHIDNYWLMIQVDKHGQIIQHGTEVD
jgi:hypothetical protein